MRNGALKHTATRARHQQRGSTLTEYGLIVALISLVAVAAIPTLRINGVQRPFCAIVVAIEKRDTNYTLYFNPQTGGCARNAEEHGVNPFWL